MTPENSIFFEVAYLAATVVLGGYVVSLIVRGRRVREREERQRRSGVAESSRT
jgi:hypothetical protein